MGVTFSSSLTLFLTLLVVPLDNDDNVCFKIDNDENDLIELCSIKS